MDLSDIFDSFFGGGGGMGGGGRGQQQRRGPMRGEMRFVGKTIAAVQVLVAQVYNFEWPDLETYLFW